MNIKEYVKPKDLKEAYDLLNRHPKNQIIGGGCWLKILPKEIEVAIDLSNCGLDKMIEEQDFFDIGSYVNLRGVEIESDLKKLFNGILSTSIGEVMGVPFRNIATIGGTVAGKFGFSDIITSLLVLDIQVVLWHNGVISIEEYIGNKKYNQDILVSIRIPKKEGIGYYHTLKKTANDFPIVNIAMTKGENGYRISIGSRPGIAVLAIKTMAYLNSKDELDEAIIDKAMEILLNEVSFGSNIRGSKEYRIEVIKGLFRKGLKEVNR